MNAKEEFINLVRDKKVLCGKITIIDMWEHTVKVDTTLKVNHSSEDYEKFLNDIDVEYDNGYGGQELYGTIWFTDGTWATRSEYDGSESWDLHDRPDPPEELWLS